MKNLDIVFVIGAGASKEFGMPLGSDLKASISSALDFGQANRTGANTGDPLLKNTLLHISKDKTGKVGFKYNELLQACIQICEGMPQAITIDNYLANHADDEAVVICGKLAITRLILSGEGNSRLVTTNPRCPNKINFQHNENTWLNKLFQALTQLAKKEHIAAQLKRIGFIVFNYDRCLEHFLFKSLENYFRFTSKDAQDILHRSLNVYHPYGTVGYLPWQKIIENLEYGKEPNRDNLFLHSKEIKTFGESQKILKGPDEAGLEKFNQPRYLVFLGFAFHEQNLAVVNRITKPEPSTRILGTTYKISSGDCDVIANELEEAGLDHSNIRLYNTPASEFFVENWRVMSKILKMT